MLEDDSETDVAVGGVMAEMSCKCLGGVLPGNAEGAILSPVAKSSNSRSLAMPARVGICKEIESECQLIVIKL